MFRRIRGVLLAVAGMFAALLAHGQGCALCYTQAASAGQQVIQGLRSGILVLIFPPMIICIVITVMAYKKRNQCRRARPVSSSDDLGW
jgi:heme/copper-type cytochrome/quinol oxidase subunit 2